ncbi:MAG TPA: PAS domain-containing protein [Alphaproteobacteria bacterium]|nr:PAS domain-containing protein [Alphaproteobacteria bacterium]
MPGPSPEFSDPRLRRFHDYWRSKRQGDRLPGRQDIDPLEIPDLLPHISILDVVGTGAAMRFRFRLVGTANVRIAGREYTGAFIDDVFDPEDAARMGAAYREIVERRKPHYWDNRAAVRGNPPVRYSRLMVPLATDGQTVDMLMGVFFFTDPPPMAA